MSQIVSIKNYVKEYENFRLELSMDIPEGIVSGIIGKNGAGKSTLIKSILGLVSGDSGEITVFGKPADSLGIEEKYEIGVAFAEAGFSSYLNIEDIASILDKMYPAFDKEKFLQDCKTNKLSEKKNIIDFSTGMKAKLRVLVAMSHGARLLILDEPTAGLDVEARMDVLDMLRGYLAEDERRTLLITSHISSDLEGLCDDIYLIDDGKVILHEDTDRIFENYAVMRVSCEDYEKMDKSYILNHKKTSYGYECFTNEKAFYLENNPGIVIEGAKLDDLILIYAGKDC